MVPESRLRMTAKCVKRWTWACENGPVDSGSLQDNEGVLGNPVTVWLLYLL